MSRKDRFNASYEISDGYAGGARPQGFAISDGDFDADGMSDNELRGLFYEMAIEDMQQKTDVVNANVDDFIAWVRASVHGDEP